MAWDGKKMLTLVERREDGRGARFCVVAVVATQEQKRSVQTGRQAGRQAQRSVIPGCLPWAWGTVRTSAAVPLHARGVVPRGRRLDLAQDEAMVQSLALPLMSTAPRRPCSPVNAEKRNIDAHDDMTRGGIEQSAFVGSCPRLPLCFCPFPRLHATTKAPSPGCAIVAHARAGQSWKCLSFRASRLRH
ncbi:hypothetical protein BC567DRAFT_85282 [Phyllosticta citribraziliensis]